MYTSARARTHTADTHTSTHSRVSTYTHTHTHTHTHTDQQPIVNICVLCVCLFLCFFGVSFSFVVYLFFSTCEFSDTHVCGGASASACVRASVQIIRTHSMYLSMQDTMSRTWCALCLSLYIYMSTHYK